MLRLGILVSGGGTNLQAILDALDQGVITNAAVSVVISNNSGAYALKRAEDRGIPAVCISPKCYDNREEFHKALLAELQKKQIDLVVLAGYLVAVPPMIVRSMLCSWAKSASFSNSIAPIFTHSAYWEIPALPGAQ